MNSWLDSSVWVMLNYPNGEWLEGKVKSYISLKNNLNGYLFEVILINNNKNENEKNEKKENEVIVQIETYPIDLNIKNNEKENFLEFERIKKRDSDNISRITIRDMTSLTHLNEPEMIRCLEERYYNDQVYTSTGPILIAINPYKTLDIYGEDSIEKYSNRENLKESNLEPHVFQISDNAYRKMLDNKFNPLIRENQSILVNGESGAGKTESTKHCLHYLAVISSSVASRLGLDSDSGNIENQIIASNPITESLGNAKTSRNNNSSRFGKFIELGYTVDGIIESAGIRTYLLENVRVNSHVEGERNFHIFYELAASSPQKLIQYGINSLCDFNYTNGTISSQNSITNIDDIEYDSENYKIFLQALETMGVDYNDQDMIDKVIIAILHMGNLTFDISNIPGDEAAIIKEECKEKHSNYICELLGITEENLMHAIGRRSLVVGTQVTIKKLSVNDTINAKDNFAKTLYSALFSWVLNSINELLSESITNEIVSLIGVLDIFGFEFFDINSLEQLCINYTNEKLQDHFNSTIFASEIELYKQEGIEIEFSGYPDNSKRLHLLENPSNGIFTLCNEKLKLRGQVSYQSLAQDLYNKCENNQYFEATKHHKNRYQFVMKHFAGDVTYSTNLFIEKNRNEVAIELVECLRSSSEAFIQNLSSYLDSSYDDVNSLTNKSSTSMRLSPVKSHQRMMMTNSNRSNSPIKTPSRSNLMTPIRQKVTFNDTPTHDKENNNNISDSIKKINNNNNNNNNQNLINKSYSSVDKLVVSTPPTVIQRTTSSSISASYIGMATRGPQRTGTSPKIQSVKKKTTLLTSFTKQLQNLIDSIKTTRSHFIRCIKPNSTKSQNIYDKQLVMSQLRCGGVLGAIQVFRAGFPNRLQFLTFIERYSVFAYVIGSNRLTKIFYLYKRKAFENSLVEGYWKKAISLLMEIIPLTHTVLTSIRIPDKGEEMVPRNTKLTNIELFKLMTEYLNSSLVKELKEGMSIGKKQVFLRASVYEYLESLLYRSNSLVARIMQYNWRFKRNTHLIGLNLSTMEHKVVYYLVNMFSIQTCRIYAKKILAKLMYFQSHFLRYYYRRRFVSGRKLSTWLTAHYRGWKVRIKVRRLRHEMAKRIQLFWRSYRLRCIEKLRSDSIKKIQFWYRTILHQRLMKKESEKYERGVIILIKLQSCWRGQQTRKQFKVILDEHMKKREAVRILFPQNYSLLLEGNNLNIFLNSINVIQILSSQNNNNISNELSSTLQSNLSSSTTTSSSSSSSTTTKVIMNPIHQSNERGNLEIDHSLVNNTNQTSNNESKEVPLTSSSLLPLSSPLSSSNQVSELEDEILKLKKKIEMLENELKVKNKRFCCF